MDVPGNWWESFFSGVAVDLWMQAIPPALTTADADLIVRLLEVEPGAALLDVPCGGGRIAVTLDRRGYRLTGVDWSEEFLAHARRGTAGVVWERRDMRDLPWRTAYDGAYCVGNSFGYLDDAGNDAFVRSVASALKPGGRFVLETPMVAESALRTVKDCAWWRVGDIHMLVANRFDPPRGRMETEYTFIADGRVEVRRSTHRVYTYRQLVDLLHAAGFQGVTGWTVDRARASGPDSGPVTLEPYRVGADDLFLVGTMR